MVLLVFTKQAIPPPNSLPPSQKNVIPRLRFIYEQNQNGYNQVKSCMNQLICMLILYILLFVGLKIK